MSIRAAGHYYQRVHDLSYAVQAISPVSRMMGNYYELPYRLRSRPPERVAIVGSGSGNDVAAALRAGAASVDAIEIDPAIQALGRLYHPERPYSDPRVHFVNDDARSFLRTTQASYDLLVYGLLDSHTLLSHASSVRLDSFVYTVEGLREARARLKPDGVVSLSFSVLSNEIGRKIYLMMQQAFDGHPPVCIHSRYDLSVIFMQSKNGGLKLPADQFLRTGFEDISGAYADPALKADVSTDDWPFFYMPRRVYPRSYLFMVGLVLLLSAAFFASFLRDRPRFSQAAFFLLGAGFMLVETKGITELGLALGNTWQVIGIVIAGVLAMAYLANGVVSALRVRRPLVPYLLLLASLGLGLAVARAGGFPPTAAGKLATVLVLTCPLFFSGMVFSTLIAGTERLSGAMALNLLGAMCGGLLEYNSMYFGFQFLYWLAIALYLAALATSLARPAGART
jgi:spermidine synthase